MKISACVIVKNEEKNMPKWLACMKNIADEMIVVDTGSTDKTVDLAETAGAQVYFYKWQDDFSAAKNFALQQASGDWILFLDADEYFTEATAGNVRSYLQKVNTNKNIDAFLCQMFNVDADNDNHMISAFQNVRIFRKDPDLFYYNKVHEILVRKNGPLKLANLEADIEIYHTGYSGSIVRSKLDRNLQIIKTEIATTGEQNWHYAYLADCYYGLKDYEQTIKYARKSIDAKIRALGNETTIYRRLIDALILAGRSNKEILAVIEEAMVKFPQEPEFIWNKAVICFQQKNYILVEKYLTKIAALRQGKKGKLKTGAFENREYLFFAMLGDIFRLKNRDQEAMKQYSHSLELNKYERSILHNFYRLLRQLPGNQVVEVLDQLYRDTKRDNEFLISVLKAYPLDAAYIYINKRLKQSEQDTGGAMVADKIISNQLREALTITTKSLMVTYEQMIAQVINDYKEEDYKLAQVLLPSLYGNALREKLTLSNQVRKEQKINAGEGASTEGGDEYSDKDEAAMEKENYTSIIIPVYNQLEKTKQCITSIRLFTQNEKYEIILIDNGSEDETSEWLKGEPDIRVISNQKNCGFTVACNQGMEIARGTEILLLQNDAIVTGNWLSGLRKVLYGQRNIGAVGPVFFGGYPEQKPELPCDYNTFDEMEFFAKKVEKLPAQGKAAMFISSFCMLLKRETIDCVGKLDEQFSPGYLEDVDYCFRILQANYRLAIAGNVFVYHAAGSTFNTLGPVAEQYFTENVALFKEKWGVDPSYSGTIRHDLLQFVDIAQKDLTLLDVGCACGANLMHIKAINESAQLYGVELNERAAEIARYFGEISNSNVENLTAMNWQKKFDYILMGDVLEHLYDPWKVVNQMRDLLRTNGYLIASIPNIMHISIIKDLLQGKWEYKDSGILDRTHLRFFTKKEIELLFAEAGFEIAYIGHTIVDFPGYEEWLNKIEQLKDVSQGKKQFEAYQWIILARKKSDPHEVSEWIKNWSKNTDVPELDQKILHWIGETMPAAETLYLVLKENISPVEPSVIRLAALLYQNSQQALALKVMICAYKEKNESSELIYALAFFLHLYGEDQEATKVLRNSKILTREMKDLLEEIEFDEKKTISIGFDSNV